MPAKVFSLGTASEISSVEFPGSPMSVKEHGSERLSFDELLKGAPNRLNSHLQASTEADPDVEAGQCPEGASTESMVSHEIPLCVHTSHCMLCI